MRLVNKSDKQVTIEFHIEEIKSIRHLMLEASYALGEEISARAGIEPKLAKKLFDELDTLIY